jgi:uncharacterized repeat protein (TIGR03847 family)
MASVIHSFDPPERFVAGTVGPPGSRTFFLQARTGPRVTSVVLEKQQVSVLAERIDELLDELLRSTEGESTIPAMPPVALEDNGPLEQPIVEEFRAGTMTLSWDATDERVVVEVFPFSEEGVVEPGTPEEEVEEPEPEEVLVVRLPAGLARAFTKRAQVVVSAGREPCPFCGSPLDPTGPPCPRAHGFRRTTADPET